MQWANWVASWLGGMIDRDGRIEVLWTPPETFQLQPVVWFISDHGPDVSTAQVASRIGRHYFRNDLDAFIWEARWGEAAIVAQAIRPYLSLRKAALADRILELHAFHVRYDRMPRTEMQARHMTILWEECQWINLFEPRIPRTAA